MKRVLCLLMMFALVSCIFCGCGSKKETSSTPVSADFISTADVNFVTADDESVYRVTRPENSEDELSEAAVSVFKKIRDGFAVMLKNLTDVESGENVAEILIGDTNREASKKAKEYLLNKGTGRKDEFLICTTGDDIVIVGTTLESTVAGVEYFVKNYLSSKTIAGGINYLYSDPSKYSEVTLCETNVISNVKIVRPIYNVSYITQLETDKLINYVSDKTGYIMDTYFDNVASNTGNNTDGSGTLTPSKPAEYEIIIGNCARDGVKEFTDKNAFEVRVEGKKVYLNGGSPYAIAAAVTEYTRLLKANNKVDNGMSIANGNYEQTVAGYDKDTYYYPTYKEDFEVNNISDLNWNVDWDQKLYYEIGGKQGYRGSKELQNNYVKEGKLYIAAVETEDAYYGGMVQTIGIMEFLYGFAEVSSLHPKGEGFWSSFWTVSDKDGQGPVENSTVKYSSETDIDECYGAGTWSYGNTFAHPTPYGREIMALPENVKGIVHVNNRVSSADDRGYWMDFHTYGFEWLDNTHVRFTCDGYVFADQALREGPEQEAYSYPQYLMLSMAAGTGEHSLTTNQDEWANTNKYIVDWVHIYQKSGQKIYTAAPEFADIENTDPSMWSVTVR